MKPGQEEKVCHFLKGLYGLRQAGRGWYQELTKVMVGDSVATAVAGVFANFPDRIAKIVGKFGDVDRAKSRGVFCQN